MEYKVKTGREIVYMVRLRRDTENKEATGRKIEYSWQGSKRDRIQDERQKEILITSVRQEERLNTG